MLSAIVLTIVLVLFPVNPVVAVRFYSGLQYFICTPLVSRFRVHAIADHLLWLRGAVELKRSTTRFQFLNGCHMTGFAILDLVVGMIFIFFLLSIITSSAVEVVLTVTKLRAKILAKWLRSIFNLPALLPDGSSKLHPVHGTPVTLGQSIMDHCMLTALTEENKSTTYIKSTDFVSAFLDQVTRVTAAPTAPGAAGTRGFQLPPKTLDEYRAAIEKTPVLPAEIKRTITAFANEAESAISDQLSKIDLFRQKIEHWYDSNAERLTGRLKRRWASPLTLLMAVCMTIALNADTVAIGSYLYDHKEVSRQLASKALTTYERYEERVERLRGDSGTNMAPADLRALEQARLQLKSDVDSMQAVLPKGFPVGWEGERWTDPALAKMSFGARIWSSGFWDEVLGRHGAGWLATVLAILLGAPFWFDMMNKVSNIRGAGPKPASSNPEDRKR
ncbi:MAG TPA: hypothetical protein VM843_08195 [Flavisolibacter sp.]|nr:hypothetical protein [Flavisolibacter sp.]